MSAREGPRDGRAPKAADHREWLPEWTPPERETAPGEAAGEAQGSGAPDAMASPRLREPRHHRVVRVGAGTRRRAITAAGVMLLIASALGAYTAVGVFGQLGSNPPPAIPQTPMPLSGPITDAESNNPLPGVTVMVVGTANQNSTNAEGWYFLEKVPPGQYTIEASKAGYTTLRKTILVSAGIPAVVPFAMPEGNGTHEYPPETTGHFQDPRGPQLALALSILLSSVFAAVGGWSAITHRHYLTAVAGAAGGTATVGLVAGLPMGTLLAAAALAVLASLKTGFLEAQSHRLPWEKRPRGRRPRQRNR